MTYTNLFDQNKLVFQKLDVIMNPKLVLNFPNFKTIIDSLRFHFEADVQAFFLNENFL